MVSKTPQVKKDYTEDALGIGVDLFSDDPIRNLINRYSPIPTVEAPKGLVPIGDNGLYATPEEPADVMDCDRYPSSIYCGGNPLTLTPVGIEPSIIIDECNIGIQLEPILGFYRLPPLSILYRRKECRGQESDYEKAVEQDVPDNFDNYNKPLKFNLLGCSEGIAGTLCTHSESYEEHHYFDESDIYAQYNQLFRRRSYIKTTTEILEINFPFKVKYLFNEDNDLAYFHIKTKVTIEEVLNRDVEKFTFSSPALSRPGYKRIGTAIHDTWLEKKFNEGSGRTEVTINIVGDSRVYADMTKGLDRIRATRNSQWFGQAPDGHSSNILYENVLYRDINYVRQTHVPIIICEKPKIVLPPPPLNKPKEKDMDCCDDLAALLASLIKKVDKLSKIVGVDDYPVSLPTSLISRDEGFLGNLIPNLNQDVPSLTRFLAWYVERFDEIMGQWEIPIEIKDSDPSKPGDQPLGVKLPNMAEAIAEMFTLVFQTNLNSETLLNFAVRTAAEGVADKQQNFITYKLMQSMAEWAGYKQKDISLKMPSLFSLSKTRYDEILNESEIDVPCVDFDEKFGLEADLMRFREAVAILQAVYKKKVDPSSDIKGQILKHLLDAFAAVNKVNGEDEDKDFDKFLTQVEDGFIKEPGVNETSEPYGRPYKERPKIRDLTKHTPPTNP